LTDVASEIRREFELNGFARIESCLSPIELVLLEEDINKDEHGPGRRDFSRHSPNLRTLVQRLSLILRDYVPAEAEPFLVRTLFFNKNNQANWSVPWHQDRTIAVKDRHEVPGYSCWTVKDGVTHVEPSLEILESMITARVHFDRTENENGALEVAMGSHVHGRISQAEKEIALERHEQTICTAEPGEVHLMSPLLLHRSRKAMSGRARRILHLEFAWKQLPSPLCWAASWQPKQTPMQWQSTSSLAVELKSVLVLVLTYL